MPALVILILIVALLSQNWDAIVNFCTNAFLWIGGATLLYFVVKMSYETIKNERQRSRTEAERKSREEREERERPVRLAREKAEQLRRDQRLEKQKELERFIDESDGCFVPRTQEEEQIANEIYEEERRLLRRLDNRAEEIAQDVRDGKRSIDTHFPSFEEIYHRKIRERKNK